MSKNNYYAVKGANIEPQIFQNWPECQSFVRGKYVKFRGFKTLPEANAFLNNDSSVTPVKKPKTTVTPTYDSFEVETKSEKGIYIYVDGSYMHKKSKYGGWGYVIVKDGIDIISAYGKTDGYAEARNIDGELEATVRAIKWMKIHMDEPFTICHDYIGISKWATGAWKANKPLTQDYKNFMSRVTKVKFKKVAAHTGDKWNDVADELAKKGITESL